MPDQTENITNIETVVDKSATDAMYTVAKVPYHQHTGVDSPQFPFTNLSDVPQNYAGKAGYTVNVNSNENGLTFTAALSPGLTTAGLFGDGSDGALTASSGTTTLTKDMYYSAVTLSGTAILKTASYRVYCSGTVTISGSANIQNNGNTGGNGGNASGSGGTAAGTAGTSGTAISSGSLPGAIAGTAGAVGGAAVNGANPGLQVAGTNGASTTISIGAAGATSSGRASGFGGSSGGNQGPNGANGGTGGTVTASINNPHSLITNYQLFDTFPAFANFTGSAAAGGSAGGSSGGASINSSSGAGGGGGGAGGQGGFVAVYANAIVNSVTGGIQSNGGSGGNGGNGGNGFLGIGAGAGGGGTGAGGAGGTGGVVIIVYKTLTQTGTFTVTGGTGGSSGATPGTGVGNGTSGGNGTAGVTGGSGVVWQYQVT